MGNENSKKSRNSQIFEIVDEKDNNNPEAINEVTVAEAEKVLDKLIIDSENTKPLKTEPPDLTATESIEENKSGAKTEDEIVTNITNVEHEQVLTEQSVSKHSPELEKLPVDGSTVGKNEPISAETKENLVDDQKVNDLTNIDEHGKTADKTKKDKRKSKKDKDKEVKKNKESKKIFKLSKKEKKLSKKNSDKDGEEVKTYTLNTETVDINYVPCQESLEKSFQSEENNGPPDVIQSTELATVASTDGKALDVQISDKEINIPATNTTEVPECGSCPPNNENEIITLQKIANVEHSTPSTEQFKVDDEQDATTTHHENVNTYNVGKTEEKPDQGETNQNYLQEAFDLIEEAKTSLPSFTSRHNPVVVQQAEMKMSETIPVATCVTTATLDLKSENHEIIPSLATTDNVTDKVNNNVTIADDTGNESTDSNMSASNNEDETIAKLAIAKLCSEAPEYNDYKINGKDFSITEKHMHSDNIDIDVNTITNVSANEETRNVTINSVTIETIKLTNPNENGTQIAETEEGQINSNTENVVKISDIDNENLENEAISSDKKKKKEKKEKKQKVPKEKKKAKNQTSNESENPINGDPTVTENASDTVHNLIKKFEDQGSEKKKEKNVVKKKKSKDEGPIDQTDKSESVQTKKEEDKKSKKKKKDKDKKMKLEMQPLAVEIFPPVKGIFDEVPVEIEVIEDDVVSLSSLSSVENDTNKTSPPPKEDIKVTTDCTQEKDEITNSNDNTNLLSVVATSIAQNRPSSEDYVTLFINKDGGQSGNPENPMEVPSTEADTGHVIDALPEIVQENLNENIKEPSDEVIDKTEHDTGKDKDIESNVSVVNDSRENVDGQLEKSESPPSNSGEKLPKKKSKKESKKNGGQKLLFRQKSDTSAISKDVPSQEVSFDLDPKDEPPRERRRSFSEFFKPLGNIFSKNNSTSQSKKKSKKEAETPDEKMSKPEDGTSVEQTKLSAVQQD